MRDIFKLCDDHPLEMCLIEVDSSQPDGDYEDLNDQWSVVQKLSFLLVIILSYLIK